MADDTTTDVQPTEQPADTADTSAPEVDAEPKRKGYNQATGEFVR